MPDGRRYALGAGARRMNQRFAPQISLHDLERRIAEVKTWLFNAAAFTGQHNIRRFFFAAVSLADVPDRINTRSPAAERITFHRKSAEHVDNNDCAARLFCPLEQLINIDFHDQSPVLL